MKKNEMHFYQLVRNFLTDYLIARRNFSDKTVRSYRQTLNLLRNYFKETKGINFERMNFSCFTRNNIYDFLIWLRDIRKSSTQTLNLRLSAIKSFLRYCGEEDMELMPLYLDISSIHSFKGTKKPYIEYLTQEQLKLLFSLPDLTTKLGRRDRFFLIFAYETGARMQELLDLQNNHIIRSDVSVRVRIQGKGNKIRYVPLLGPTVKHLDSYQAEFHKNSSDKAFLFYTIHDSQHTKMKPGTVDYFMKKYGKLAHKVNNTFPEGLHGYATIKVYHGKSVIMKKLIRKSIPAPFYPDTTNGASDRFRYGKTADYR